MKVGFISLGCKVNRAETEELKEKCWQNNYEIVSRKEKADVFIINTCTITSLADKKSRQNISKILKENKKSRIIVTGCFVENFKKIIKSIDKRIIVIDNKDKKDLINFINSSGKKYLFDQRHLYNHARSFIKIQNGCSNFCKYCIIPFVRGKEKSTPSDKIIKIIKDKTKRGYQEIILTGINIGKYRYKTINLEVLIRKILSDTVISRIRLSSIEPPDFDCKLLKLFKNQRLCRHIHLPLQAGCNKTLKAMGRNYKTADFEKTIRQIRKEIPQVAITTDVIVGFPGETDKDFENTYNFIRKNNFTKLHIFKYSPRVGTKAVTLPLQLDDKTKKERAQKLSQLNEKLEDDFKNKFLGKKLSVLFEKKSNLYYQGLSDNYIKVFVKSDSNLINKVVQIKIIKPYREGIYGIEIF